MSDDVLASVKIVLVDLNASLVEAWQEAFIDCDLVFAKHDSLLTQTTDAIVSPANSFGFMDGGLDLRLSQHFGWGLEKQARAAIFEDHDGELPVGQALIVPTEHPQVPWLICAPTMRVPMNVANTTNAHLAFRAILRAVRSHNLANPDALIQSVACPGLGTGEGAMPARRCARQMRYAYEMCFFHRPVQKGGLAAAAENHMHLIDYDY